MAREAAAVGRAIGGGTRLYAVIGDPVAQVQAPALLNPVFAHLGLDAVLVPVHAEPAHLTEVLRGLTRMRNLDGLLVTVPHKIATRAFADRESRMTTLAGSTNALRREPDGGWFAENFDGVGFVRGLEAAGFAPAGRRVALIGAGGAGGALAAALLLADVAEVAVCDPDREKLGALVDRLRPHFPGRIGGGPTPGLAGADLVVNATPLGLRPQDPLPFDLDALPAGAVVADIIMKPKETALLRAAAARGHPVQYGYPMLAQQLDLYRDFFGLGRPDEAVRAGRGA